MMYNSNKHFFDNHRILEETCDIDVSKCIKIIALEQKRNVFLCATEIIPATKWIPERKYGELIDCEWEDK